MATLVLSITRALTETGLETALIQREHLEDETLNVGFTVVLGRAGVVAAIMAIGAPAFANFFHEPRVADLLRVLALGILFEGSINMRVPMYQRALDFRRYFFFHASGQITALTVTIASALVLHDVWAVVYGQLAGSTAKVLMSYALERRRPRLQLKRDTLRELLGYGRWVSASSVLLFLLVNGDNLFIGKVIGATELAYYNWAYQLANLPALFITQILSSVMFPALASVRGDRPRLADLFVRSMRLTWLISLPGALLIGILVEPFTRAMLGERWLPIIPIAHALCAFGFMRALGASAGALFLAVGRPDLRAKLQIAQVVVFAATLYPLYSRFGVLGVAWSVTAYGFLSVYAAYLCFDLCEISLAALGRPTLAATLASLLGAAAAWLCALPFGPPHALLALVAGSGAGVLVTLAVLAFLDRGDALGYRAQLSAALRSMRKRQA
jgi:O-antigen/teichoic acid export membrane protein